MTEAYIVEAVRTPVGRRGGGLSLQNLQAPQRPLPGAAVDANVCCDVRIVDASAAQRFDAQPQIGVATIGAPAQQIPLTEHSCYLHRKTLQAELSALHDHVRQSRVSSESCECTTVRRDSPLRVDGRE